MVLHKGYKGINEHKTGAPGPPSGYKHHVYMDYLRYNILKNSGYEGIWLSIMYVYTNLLDIMYGGAKLYKEIHNRWKLYIGRRF